MYPSTSEVLSLRIYRNRRTIKVPTPTNSPNMRSYVGFVVTADAFWQHSAWHFDVILVWWSVLGIVSAYVGFL